VDDLVALALADPHEARARARAVLAGQPDDYAAAVAHQALGIVARDIGDIREAVRELRLALRLARRSGPAERETGVLATLGSALVLAGRTEAGLAEFDWALRQCSGVLAGQVLHRRATIFWILGRHDAALDDLRRALTLLGQAGDRLWTARALSARGLVYTDLGFPDRADADFVAAGRWFAEAGKELESIYTMQNRAMTAFVAGDLVAALSHLDEAADRYRQLDVPAPALSIDRCAVLLAAGLTGDALAEAEAAVRDIEQSHGRATWRAGLLLTAARCALAADKPQAALGWAKAAADSFRSQQSSWWQAHAAGVLAQARYAACERASTRLLRESDLAASRLTAAGSGEAARAHLLAGRVALKLGRLEDADRHFAQAAQSRRRGPAWSRASGWLGEALRAQAAGDPRRMLTACRRGLDVLDEHRLTLGASELRAQVTAHGTELAALAQRHASRAHRPRLLLAWSERWRATALAVPAVRPAGDTELGNDLAAYRAAVRRLETARQSQPTASVQRELPRLEREQRRLERTIRGRAFRAKGISGREPAMAGIPELLGELGTARLLEIVDIDDTLHVLACGNGKVRQFTAGRASSASAAAGHARMTLRRLARSRPGDYANADSDLTILKTLGLKLQDALLGPAGQHLGDGPVIIVPPGKLHAVPWPLIPALSDRVISVAPSAQAWMRARATAPPARHNVTLACGPGLPTNGAEIPQITGFYEDVTVLTGDEADTKKVLPALDGAWLAHIAAHGTFRADSPLFSPLLMADGPLIVYEFEQLHRAPYRLVLSSCDSGAMAPAGADELLGLAASLLPLGTAGIIASIVPVNDYAVVPVMVAVHRYLRGGQTLAESLHSVRAEPAGDPIQHATALSLVALGAA
jgi:tetratricopeptide (TPR) repeat protein